MKKAFFTLILISICFKGFSQEENESDNDYTTTIYGVRAVFNYSSLTFGNSLKVFDNKNRIGAGFGFFADIELSESFLFSPELQFSAAGAKDEMLQLDYLSLPLLFKYNHKGLFAFSLGPVPSLKVNRYYNTSLKQNSYSLRQLTRKDYNYFSLAASAGFEVTLWEHIFSDIRYYYGFTNVFSENYLLSATNSIIQVGVGLKF